MKRLIKCLSMCMMAVAILLSVTGCMMEKPWPEYESEFFKYAVWTNKDGTQEAYLTGFTELGKEQTELILPCEIDGIPIRGFGYCLGGAFGDCYERIGEFCSENLKKIYVPFNGENWEWYWGLSSFVPHARFVIWNSWKLSGNALGSLPNNHGTIIGYNLLNDEMLKMLSYVSQKDTVANVMANVIYQYNYEMAENSGYYWVDSYDNDIITFIPPEPTREGYVFKGWYKETECINIWNFASDTVGPEIWRKEGCYKLNEYDQKEITYLYAKWEEE